VDKLSKSGILEVMNPKDAYKYCPKCGGKLQPEKENYLTCQSCGFHLFINCSLGIGIIIENENGEILLTKRKIEPGKGSWDIPGGFIQPNETLEEGAKRELREELGIEIEIDKYIGTYPHTYVFQDIAIPMQDIFLRATIVSGVPEPNDDVEDFRYFSKDNLPFELFWSSSMKKALADYLNM
jgi:ADP-ribose pyrophosphatase YjhB (NUDIX family)